DATPSTEDIRLTQDAGRVGEILGVQVLDHIIVAGDGYVSLREKGMYVPSAVPAAH
ncbi:MAG: JAB domain-containing protein, partial [Anaerolineae bacterium]